MKTKILLPILVTCLLVICGCGNSEQLASDIAATTSVTTEPIAVTTPANEEIGSEEVAEPQEPISASETVELPTISENADERTEETVPTHEVELQVLETQPSETMTPSETIPTVTEPVVIETSVNEPSASETTEKPIMEEKPVPIEPLATESSVIDSSEVEPETEFIDTAALESYGRSYASDAYGYNGTSECTPDSGAGYFPASTKTITSQEEAERIIQEAIDSQYKRDEAYGYTPYEEVDGETVRCPVNVEVIPTGEPNEYTITVYYGGTA